MDPRGNKGTKYKQSEIRLICSEWLDLSPDCGKHNIRMKSKVSLATTKTVLEEKMIRSLLLLITK